MTHLRTVADPTTVDAARLERSITVKDAAGVLGCDRTTVRDMLEAGQLRGHRIGVTGRGIRIYEASIREYRESAQIEPKKAVPRRPPEPRRQAGPSAEALEAVAFLQSIGAADQD